MGAIWAGGGLYEMFTTLSRPVWCIPYEALLPVWSALHVAAAIALWRHWALRVQDNGRATLWFLLQYLFGVLWPFIYFEQQRPVAALSCAAIWWATSIGWLAAGRRISRFSALLLAPYTMWPLYLMALNFAIIRLNAHELAR